MKSLKMPSCLSPVLTSKGVANLCFLGLHLIFLASAIIPAESLTTVTRISFSIDSSAGAANRVLTYFTDKAIPWNDAAELCGSRGSRLLTTDSEDVRLAVEYFSDHAWENYWTREFWTGLHRVNREYMWQASCEPMGTYTAWKLSEVIAGRRCVAGHSDLEEDSFWVLRMCNNDVAMPICEKQAGQCTFVERPDTEVQGLTREYHANLLGLVDCQQACLSDTGQPECWAVTYVLPSCYFFRALSMAELIDHSDDTAANSRPPLYVKMCFEAQLDHTSLTVLYNDPIQDNGPWAGCFEPVHESTTVLSTEDYHGQTAAATTTSAWPSRETTATTALGLTTLNHTHWLSSATPIRVPTTQEPATTTTSEISTHSVNSSNITLYEWTRSTNEGSRAPEEERTTALHKATTAAVSAELSNGSPENVKGITSLAGRDALGRTSTRTSMSTRKTDGPKHQTQGEIDVSLGTASITARVDPESSVSVSTALGIDTTGYQKEEWCECQCQYYVKLNQSEKKKFTEKLISSLAVNKSDISSNRRRYESAHDPRPSAQSVGWLGLVLLCVTFGGLFLTDFSKLYRDITCKTSQKY